LDAQLAEVNEEARTTGRIDEATYQKTVEHLAAQMAATENIQGEVNEAFVEGWIEGYENELAILESIPEYAGRIVGDVTAAVGRGAGKGLGSILGGIPWWLWLAGGVALFVYLGGGRVVEQKARRKISVWGEK
jgi:alanine dehydrogenase